MRRLTPTVLSFVLVFLSVLVTSCFKLRGFYGTRSFEPVSRPVDVKDIKLPEGYTISLVAKDLTYPTSVTFDDKGALYVTEAGYSYGEIFTTPRLLKVGANGSVTVIAKGGKNGPWTNVFFYDGNFYVSEGGTMEGGRILRISGDGKIEYILQDLPSYGDHHTNGVIVHNGYLYFGQGTATNSGVVGKDNWNFGWLIRKKDFHDIPCEDVTLAGLNFETANLFSDDHEKIKTGAYVPYGTSTEKGQVIKGSLPCSGAVMRVPVKGGAIELVSWGFRNPYGLAFDEKGVLYVSDNGYDRRGSRPVYGAGDLLWRVEEKRWYGWPDYSGRDSLAGENFQNREFRPKSVLLKHPDAPPAPVAVFGVHSSSNGFDFSRNATFGHVGKAFVAQFGDMAPNVGDVYGPVGFKVVSVDVTNGDIVDFVVNKGHVNGPASTLKSGGIERPVSVRFSPDGREMYIVDFGVMEITSQGPSPKKNTGVIWKVTRF
jgi:glucose/arabinose dehydrogenase